MPKWILTITALSGLAGCTGVVLSGIAAHGSAGPLLETGARVLTLHAVAALGVAALASALPKGRAWFLGAALLFLVGGFLFSGDLATRALVGSRLFPMAAPLGATLLIVGWVCLSVASLLAMARKAD